jgi:dynein heavy chain, axonemal
VAIKKDELGLIKAEIDKMEADYNQLQEYIQQLSDDKIRSERRLTNAGKLINLLGDEGERWLASVGIMEAEIEKLIGNVFIAAASISYIGPFTGFYRDILIEQWVELCKYE